MSDRNIAVQDLAPVEVAKGVEEGRYLLVDVREPNEVAVEAYPDAEVLAVAKAQFARGNYGHAARYYERAVEVAPNNGEAWLGLAASYDRVRRFDLADRAYREAGRYLGNRPEYYNNIGYSFLLRGEPAKARANFLKAHGWRAGAGYQPGEPNYVAIQAWNAATVYEEAIAIMGKQIDGASAAAQR